MRWTKDKLGKLGEVAVDSQYTLWDGGVYDNLGLEALYKMGKGLDKEIDFLMVSNASASISHQKRKGNASLSNVLRLMDIAMSQVDALRSRDFYASVFSKDKGIYLKIGNTAREIADNYKIPAEKAGTLISGCLESEDVARVRDYATTLNAPLQENFDLIFRHGYESAQCTHQFREIATGLK
jgi:NTE family protein